MSCGDVLPELFTESRDAWHIHLRGRVRIELPRYRVRGLCTIRSSPAGDLRIDFHHSSLFGAYREDAVVFLRNGEIGILDRERGVFYGNDSTLSMLSDHLEFNVHSDDIAYLLLFEAPPCDGIPDAGVDSGRSGWRVSGSWRGRSIEIEGRTEGGPTSFRQCLGESAPCYTARYQYGGGETPVPYPSGITVSREYGTERISLTVRDVKRERVDEGVFELFDSLTR